MKHLPFNHAYRPIGCGGSWRFADSYDFRKIPVTNITLLCRCGKITVREIANFVMTADQIDTYVSTVYPER